MREAGEYKPGDPIGMERHIADEARPGELCYMAARFIEPPKGQRFAMAIAWVWFGNELKHYVHQEPIVNGNAETAICEAFDGLRAALWKHNIIPRPHKP